MAVYLHFSETYSFVFLLLRIFLFPGIVDIWLVTVNFAFKRANV